MIKLGDIVAYDVQEVAKMLDVSAQTVRNYIHKGTFKAQKVGQKYVITEQVLKEYLTGEVKE